MSAAPFRIEALESSFDRSAFACGSPELDNYLRTLVSQDIRRRVATCFVALTAGDEVAGFYTLTSSSVLIDSLPVAITRKLPRYPLVPAARLGRLAVDTRFQRLGLGAALLVDALQRLIASDIGIYAMVVDAKDDGAAKFYVHHGFQPLLNSPRTLFLPLESAAKALKR